ncbi:glycerophosphodiester phosphodiesterase [Pontibacillus salicampi]|uniref:Glycerophosphodiester phosphodiesterase n=2 Tax=Pontibacillus salicampi TaxID=1449801 RepID=A0ABV6LT24_9BACI
MNIFAHRGSSGFYPENTMIAFEKAIDDGVHGVELDVQLTKDGQMVVIHDETITRTTNGAGYVKDFTLHELKQYDAGGWFPYPSMQRIPTLDEVLRLLQPTSLQVNIELKNDVIPYAGLEEKVVSIIQEYNMESRIILSSFVPQSIQKVSQLAPFVERALLCMENQQDPIEQLHKYNANALHCHYRLISPSLLERAKALHIPIRVFTVNDKDNWLRMMELGVDAIFTDYPLEKKRGKASGDVVG